MRTTSIPWLETHSSPRHAGNTLLRRHFESVAIDQHEGRIAGLDAIGTTFIGGPLTTVEQFIEANRERFSRMG